MYKHNVEIVISRYNEDLSWLNEYPFTEFEYIVYNKGINDNFEKNNVKQIINLPNVGRCDHTYLYHIINNYENLSNIVVFLPGSVNNKLKINKAKDILTNIIDTNYRYAFFLGEYHKNLCNSFKDFKLDKYSSSDINNYSINNEDKLKKCNIRPYGKWYKYFFGDIVAHWCTFTGIFSIDKRDIIQHPINKYQFLIQTVNNHSNPEAGHYLERSWGALFYPLIHTVKVSY
jgi:hypothetical protein